MLKATTPCFLGNMYCGGGRGGSTFIQTLRIAACQLWLTQAIVCTALFNKFSPKKKNPVGINWAPKILIYTVHLAFIGNKIPFLIQPFQVTGLSGFQFTKRPHKITQIVLGMTIITSLLTA